MQLGKIEKYILVWGHRQHEVRGVQRVYSTLVSRGLDGQYLGKSGALLSYARELLGKGAVPKHSANIKSCLPARIYSTLHSSFTRALKRLAEKGLLVYEPDGTLLRSLKRNMVKSFKKPGQKGYRRSMFMLTPRGEAIGRQLWHSQKRQV